MTKRLYTAEKVLEAVLDDVDEVDDDQDYNHPDEPVMEALTMSFQTWNWMKMTLTSTYHHQTQ